MIRDPSVGIRTNVKASHNRISTRQRPESKRFFDSGLFFCPKLKKYFSSEI